LVVLVVVLQGIGGCAQRYGLEGSEWCMWQGVLRRVCEYCVHGGQLVMYGSGRLEMVEAEWHFGVGCLRCGGLASCYCLVCIMRVVKMVRCAKGTERCQTEWHLGYMCLRWC